MSRAVLTTETREKFDKLADLLEKASRLAREISRGEAKPTEIAIPTLKRPKHVPKDEEWFWSEEWQKGEREVNKALADEDYEIFESADDLIKDLHSHL
ncbi:MAG: hypothetical protein IPM53_18050 [Anaerolineaceae bacterium]|nr:hypothetical protein [Anaerolineaceae bacterium]